MPLPRAYISQRLQGVGEVVTASLLLFGVVTSIHSRPTSELKTALFGELRLLFHSFHSIIPDISTVLLQAHYYSEAYQTLS